MAKKWRLFKNTLSDWSVTSNPIRDLFILCFLLVLMSKAHSSDNKEVQAALRRSRERRQLRKYYMKYFLIFFALVFVGGYHYIKY